MTEFGVLMFPTDYAMPPQVLAAEAEARGFGSVFFPEHTHIPTSRQTPWPGGGELPREYLRTHDPFIALTAAAMVTKSIKLGTGICLVTERDPIVMAKQVASLDLLSGGRVILGVGAGWNVEEMANHGTAFATRWALLRERVLAMRQIWAEDKAEFHGEFVDFDPIWSYPKPAQVGGPLILLGASSRWAYARIAEYADGWMPIYQNAKRREAQGGLDYAAGVKETREAWRRADRPGDPDLSVFGVPPSHAAVEELIDAGFNRLIFGLPADDADTVLPLMDRLAELAAKYRQPVAAA
jgi:probable F420-dependent oxidoreductase